MLPLHQVFVVGGFLLLSITALAQDTGPKALWQVGFEDAELANTSYKKEHARISISDTVAFRGDRSRFHEHFAGVSSYVSFDLVCPLTLNKGQTYTFSAWVRCEQMDGGRATFFVFYPGATQYAAHSLPAILQPTDWTQITATVTPDRGIEKPFIRFQSWPAYGILWIDELYLVEGDKPMPASKGEPRDERKPADYFVSASGRDSNSGTSRDAPFQSVAAAVRCAVPGSTITLLPGRYEGGWTLKPGGPRRPIALRAERAGRVLVGSIDTITGLRPVAGCEYSYATSFPVFPRNLRELDTGSELRCVATPIDVEEVVGSYCYDEKSKRVYVHPTDSAGTAHHTYAPIPKTKGVTVASYTVVDGLVMTGFGDHAIGGSKLTGVTVQNCKLYRNGYGIVFGGSRNCVIRNNEVWENRPDYWQGGQLSFQGKTEGLLVEGNVVHGGLGQRNGIFIYSDHENKNNIFRRNLIWGVNGATIKPPGKNNLAEYNVCITAFGTNVMRYNTFSGPVLANPDPQTDLRLWAINFDPKFVDSAWRDYRLQSDSPARGKGKNGTDLGAFQYKGDAFFVKPGGDDKAEGTSVASAWKTLAHATKMLEPGETLYVFPGKYDEPLRVRGRRAANGAKTLIRVHGKGKAWVRAVEVVDCASLELANFSVTAASDVGFRITKSRDVTLLHCASYLNKGDGVRADESNGVSVRRCALWQNGGTGLKASKSSDVEMVSSIAVDNRQAQVRLAQGTQGYYGNFNAFRGSILGQIRTGNAAEDLAEWRRLTASEGRSLILSAEPIAPAEGDFRIPAGTLLAIAGLYDSAVGPDGVAVTERVAREPIESVEVVSVTRTSANILWYTPGRMWGTALQWGLTPEYGRLYDRTTGPKSEFELVHTASLINLKPGTTYHFRVGCLDLRATEEEKANGQAPMIWSKDYTFATAQQDPKPRQLYVSLEGDDANDGLSRKTDWRTLHKAAREARAGDTVTILPGRYVELLRPLQTGTSEDRRITFRAERPLTVFLDGGTAPGRQGRPHAVQLHGKAFITVENLTAERCGEHDYGGYRGGCGYAGAFRISGGAMNEIKGCVVDARGRAGLMTGFFFYDAGLMHDLEKPKYSLRISDSITLGCWSAVRGSTHAPLLLDHNIYWCSTVSLYKPHWPQPKWVSRNCIYQDLGVRKRYVGCGCTLFETWQEAQFLDSDYGCFAWMPGSQKHVVRLRKTKQTIYGMRAWQEVSGQDLHSIEHTPKYPLTTIDEKGGHYDQSRVLRINDFILPKDSPLRGRGTDGSDIGVRWEKWLVEP